MNEFVLSDYVSDNREPIVYADKVKELITRIRIKVLLNWKGKEEFVKWLEERTGNKLIEKEKTK